MLMGDGGEKSPRRSSKGLKDGVRMILEIRKRLVQAEEIRNP
jgi:hypothetical protein